MARRTTDLDELARLRRARDRIDRDFAQPLDVAALARGAYMSDGHFSRRFREAYGESPYAYLMTRRVERAMTLLQTTELSVTEIAMAVGSASLGTFTTRFTELVGVPPGRFRAEGPPPGDLLPCVARRVRRPVRNREAQATER